MDSGFAVTWRFAPFAAMRSAAWPINEQSGQRDRGLDGTGRVVHAVVGDEVSGEVDDQSFRSPSVKYQLNKKLLHILQSSFGSWILGMVMVEATVEATVEAITAVVIGAVGRA
jgi:hypothetical protein